MHKNQTPPVFLVHKSTMLGVVPFSWIFFCVNCEQDLSEWVMEQSPKEPTECPHCELPIEGQHVAWAQRATKKGCLLSLAGLAAVFLIPAAIVGVSWLAQTPTELTVSQKLSQHVQLGEETIVDFAEIAPFDWDRVFFFPPDTPPERIRAAIGFQWDQAGRTTIERNDGVTLVVFVGDAQVVHWFEHSRREDLTELADLDGYTRRQAKFRVISAGVGRLKLIRLKEGW